MFQVWWMGACYLWLPLTGKRELGGAQPGQAHPSTDRPGVETIKSVIRSNAGLLQNDLYLNPDPLVCLLGKQMKHKLNWKDKISKHLLIQAQWFPKLLIH